MAYTIEQYNALCAAIASGAQSVMYGNKQVMYKSTEAMKEVKRDMEKELGLIKPRPTRRYAKFSKGL